MVCLNPGTTSGHLWALCPAQPGTQEAQRNEFSPQYPLSTPESPGTLGQVTVYWAGGGSKMKAGSNSVFIKPVGSVIQGQPLCHHLKGLGSVMVMHYLPGALVEASSGWRSFWALLAHGRDGRDPWQSNAGAISWSPSVHRGVTGGRCEPKPSASRVPTSSTAEVSPDPADL